MRIDTRPDGSQLVVPEKGDLVRLTRDEPGPIVTAHAGEWGRILRVTNRNTLDIQLAGFSRPRGVALGVVSDIATTNVIPGYAKGLRFVIPKWANWKNVTARSKSKGS